MTMTGAQSYPKGATMPDREEQRRKQAIARQGFLIKTLLEISI
jgi:hypothetical protein